MRAKGFHKLLQIFCATVDRDSEGMLLNCFYMHMLARRDFEKCSENAPLSSFSSVAVGTLGRGVG